ncbi:MAG: iron-only hydrogenase system regulator [Spirochaetia bacterium]|jgi:putative iron-only hydrogenase system regulator|nr:iron-only hydrogenase system regulator [Spirochaetia bacterium]
METRIAILAIIIESGDSVEQVNECLHEAASYIIGRMGLPYPKKHLSVISIVLDAPQDFISSLAGRLGQIPSVSIKATYSKV